MPSPSTTPPTAPRRRRLKAAVLRRLVELRQRWRALALCLVLGLVGAGAFLTLRFPLPWMLGPLVFVGIAALAGAKVWIPRWLRAILFVVLGAAFGTTVKPELGGQVVHWLPSMIAVVIYVGVALAAAYLYFRMIMGLDPVTAYFSAAPGGLTVMTVLGGELGGDARIISLMQMTRLIVTVLVIPFGFRFFAGYVPPPGGVGVGGSFADMAPMDAVLMIVACVVSIPLGRLVRLPSPVILAPLVAVAVLTASGAITSTVPAPLLAAAQWVIGASVGAMFNGIHVRVVARTLAHGTVTGLVMTVLAVLVAVGLGEATHVSDEALILGFVPGGVAEMALIAFALGLEVPFVVGHQLIRIVIIVVFLPLLFSRVRGG